MMLASSCSSSLQRPRCMPVSGWLHRTMAAPLFGSIHVSTGMRLRERNLITAGSNS
jgi:hypothetical protein